MDQSGYVLKSREELEALIRGRDHFLVVSCNKCFKEYTTSEEPEPAALKEILAAQGKCVTGVVRVDFLCSRGQAERKLSGCIPEGTEHILVLSCGLGVQMLAELAADGELSDRPLPVYTAADTVSTAGHHGMALTAKSCGVCAQCYLGLTGGVCPVIDCSKSLINGQCGGAKDGHCEVDPHKDCAWEKIMRRLKKQGRLEEWMSRPVLVRDFGKIDQKTVAGYVKAVREDRASGFFGGVHPVEGKDYTEDLPLTVFPEPEEVVIPLGMHIGAPAVPVVQVGDHVMIGQRIAEAAAYVSCPVHASISGTVTAVEPRMTAGKGEQLSIVIQNDRTGSVHESVKPHGEPEELTPEEIIGIVRNAGITGMGGAGFPTHVKLAPDHVIDAVLLNGCECEPLLTADHRIMLEYPDDVLCGLRAIMKAVSAPRGILVIEDNKPEAVELMRRLTEDCEGIEVCAVRTQYPQGAEKMIVRHVLKRKVPSGGLPSDVGALVSNVSTAKAIADALRKGMPLIERAVTVSGEGIARPGNYLVKIGTCVRDLIAFSGGVTGEDHTIRMGGPMMGVPITNQELPVVKTSNGIIAVKPDSAVRQECIRCGRCVDVCPMELAPLNFVERGKDAQVFIDNGIRDCFLCGCCEYICSSKIPLVSEIRNAKQRAIRCEKAPV